VDVLLLGVMVALPLGAAAQEAVVHEAWFVHMESAGGWVGVEKGLYGKVKVNEVQGGPGISPFKRLLPPSEPERLPSGMTIPRILSGHGKKRDRSGGCQCGFPDERDEDHQLEPDQIRQRHQGQLWDLDRIRREGKCAVGKGWEKQFTIQNQGGDIKPWLVGQWPLASAMIYNELITAQRETKKMGKTFYTTDYKDLGIDWMDNILFTTEEIVKKYPDVVQAVVAGRYQGFKWALENPKETFEIMKKINDGLDLSHEMDAVGPMKSLLVTADTKKSGMGFIQPKKWENIGRDLFKASLLDKMPEVKKVYTDKFASNVIPK